MEPAATRPARARARIEVLLGALAFGASVPAGKLLLRDIPPLALSGGLYLAAGLSCAAVLLVATRHPWSEARRLRGREWGWLAASVAAGGVLAPLALFDGLRQTSGHVAGLLLNLETVFTIALAALWSGERVGGRGLGGILLVIGGALVLSLGGEPSGGSTRPWGPLLVVAACACWGLDNNFAQRVSVRDARLIVAVKGVVGGIASLSLAAVVHQLGSWTPAGLASVLAVGAVSFGLSIVLFVRGLRHLGVMLTGALFALAPGFAALLAWATLRESVDPPALVALLGMTGGAVLLSTDVHRHPHTHAALEHAHESGHDEDHQPGPTTGELAGRRQAPWHRHEPVTHAHEHTHDIHHRHPH